LRFRATEESFPAVGLREISRGDAIEADRWSPKRATWSWERLFQEHQSNSGIKRFDTAVLEHGRLLGLAYGVPSKSKLVLKLHTIEGKPSPNPLKGQIVPIILAAAGIYARFLGSQEIWLCNPLNESLVSYYQLFGYSPHRNEAGVSTHLSRKV
jgi:hypothetical protein